MRFLILALCLIVLPALGAEPTPDQIILRLKKANLELAMENLKLRYEKLQAEWKALAALLGEDTDAVKEDKRK